MEPERPRPGLLYINRMDRDFGGFRAVGTFFFRSRRSAPPKLFAVILSILRLQHGPDFLCQGLG